MTKTAMTANVAKTVYTVTNSARRFWDPASAITVYYNDVAVTDYASIQEPGGVVTWAETPGNDAVTVSGKYLNPVLVGYAKAWTLDGQYNFADTTVFGDTMQVNTPIFLGATATIESFYADETLFTEMTAGGTVCGLELYIDATLGSEKRYIAYGTISSLSINSPVDGVVEQPISFSISDGPFYMGAL